MQINRMFEIIYILLNQKIVTAKELSTRFEVSTRTIYRDIETLSAAGIPVYMTKGKGGGISLLENFVLNKTVLTNEEKSDILSSLKAVDAINFNETDTAIKKLGSLFGDSPSDWIEIDFSSWYNSEKESQIFNTIKAAILSKQMISFSYASGKMETTKREVEPLKLCFKGMSRYLYAYCTLRKDFRFFKLSRIKDLLLIDKNFERVLSQPIFNSELSFSDEYVTLKLRISPKMSFRVYDEFDTYTQDSEGYFIAESSYPLGEFLFPYIASFGAYCEVLEPAYVRDSIKDELEKILKNYS